MLVARPHGDEATLAWRVRDHILAPGTDQAPVGLPEAAGDVAGRRDLRHRDAVEGLPAPTAPAAPAHHLVVVAANRAAVSLSRREGIVRARGRRVHAVLASAPASRSTVTQQDACVVRACGDGDGGVGRVEGGHGAQRDARTPALRHPLHDGAAESGSHRHLGRRALGGVSALPAHIGTPADDLMIVDADPTCVVGAHGERLQRVEVDGCTRVSRTRVVSGGVGV